MLFFVFPYHLITRWLPNDIDGAILRKLMSELIPQKYRSLLTLTGYFYLLLVLRSLDSITQFTVLHCFHIWFFLFEIIRPYSEFYLVLLCWWRTFFPFLFLIEHLNLPAFFENKKSIKTCLVNRSVDFVLYLCFIGFSCRLSCFASYHYFLYWFLYWGN